MTLAEKKNMANKELIQTLSDSEKFPLKVEFEEELLETDDEVLAKIKIETCGSVDETSVAAVEKVENKEVTKAVPTFEPFGIKVEHEENLLETNETNDDVLNKIKTETYEAVDGSEIKCEDQHPGDLDSLDHLHSEIKIDDDLINLEHEMIRNSEKQFKCNMCSKTLSTLDSLKAHQRLHTGEKPYKRNLCTKTFSCSSHLKEHENTHTGEKLFECNTCNKQFLRKSVFRRHERIHTTRKPFETPQQTETCDFVNDSSVTSIENVQNEKMEDNGVIELVAVPVKIEHEENSLQTNDDVLNIVKVEKCDVVDESEEKLKFEEEHASDVDSLHTEIKTEPDTDLKCEKQFKCNLCSETFSRAKYLRKHKKVHTGAELYKCDVCFKTFSHACYLETHYRIHSGEKPYKCNVCFKTFSQSSGLNTHYKIHSGKKPHKCSICFKTFTTSGTLNSHYMTHTGAKPYQCSVCFKTFTRSSSLKSHKVIHTGEKSHKCNYCSKMFSQLSDLKIHERIHTGEKPYKCDTCFKTFARSDCLKIHERIHTGEKPFTCNICFKAFSRLSNLITHNRTHTGEKPYQCNVCFKTFSQSGSLKEHDKRVHKQEKS